MAEHQRPNPDEEDAKNKPDWPRIHQAGSSTDPDEWLYLPPEKVANALSLLRDIYALLERSRSLIAETRRLAEESKQFARSYRDERQR